MQNIMVVIEDEHRTVIKIQHILILQDSGVQISIILRVVFKEARESVIRTKEDTADKQRIMVKVNTSWLNHINDQWSTNLFQIRNTGITFGTSRVLLPGLIPSTNYAFLNERHSLNVGLEGISNEQKKVFFFKASL